LRLSLALVGGVSAQVEIAEELVPGLGRARCSLLHATRV
jgi:hypothetical protein